MKRPARYLALFAIAAIALLVAGALFWRRPPDSPPSVSVSLLGYTNRVGPHALLAITNASNAAITLDLMCMVNYAAPGSVPRRVVSVDGNRFRLTRLRPNQGFVQEFYVFPAPQGEWQFAYYAAYSSGWFETRRSLEGWLRKHFRRLKFSLPSKGWSKFETEWFPCPP